MYVVATFIGLTYACAGINIGALIWGPHTVWPLSVGAMLLCIGSGVYQTGCLIRIARERS